MSKLEKSNTSFENLKERKETFWLHVFRYWKKRPIVAFFLLLTVIISSFSGIYSPKIIQNLTKILSSYNVVDPITGEIIFAKITTTKFLCFDFTWQDWLYLQLGLIVLTAIFTYVSNYLGGLIGRGVEIELRNRTLEHLVKMDMGFYSDKKIGEILTKVVSDTQIIADQAQQIPILFLGAGFTFFGSMGILYSISWQISTVVLINVFLVVIFLLCSFRIIKKLLIPVRAKITEINGDVTDRISTISLIKSSGTENEETARFIDIHKDYYQKSKQQLRVQATVITILTIMITSIQTVILVTAAIMYHNKPVEFATILSSFISGAGSMISSIMQAIRGNVGLINASTSATRIYEINKQKRAFDPFYGENDGIKLDKINGNIIFDHVNFAYPDKKDQLILKDFSFKFEQGKAYAFVGETGVGKSTISKLLLRFYDPLSGSVLINDNINLKDIKLSTYLSKVGYVEQEPQILFGNIYDNVKYGSSDATDEDVVEACKKAELHDLISTWKEGYETILGERGFILSGGQKQRLVIARMFLKDPQLLILDEATSALDNIVEKEIQGNFEKLMKGRTTFMIAHRLSTIKNADQILVLAKGEGVAQIGTFDELKTKPGHFKKLYDAGLMD